MNSDIEALPNLGPASCRWLREAGIRTIVDLEQLGAVAAFQLVKQVQPKASLNLLWALAAGLQMKDWRELTQDEKQALLDELREYEE